MVIVDQDVPRPTILPFVNSINRLFATVCRIQMRRAVSAFVAMPRIECARLSCPHV